MVEPVGGLLEAPFPFAGLHHALHDAVEIRVAAVDHGLAQIVLGVGTVATDQLPIAGKAGAGSDPAFIQRDEALHHFPDGPRSVGGLDGPVEQGFVGVDDELPVVFAPLGTDQPSRIEVGRGDQGQHFSTGRLDGDYAAFFAVHQGFGELLQSEIEGEGQILTGFGRPVVGGCGSRVPHLVPGIHHHGFSALDASQFELVHFLEAAASDAVPHLVEGVRGQVVGGGLRVFAQQVSGGRIEVVPDRPGPEIKAREAVTLGGHLGVFRGVESLSHGGGFVRAVAPGPLKSVPQLLFRHAAPPGGIGQPVLPRFGEQTGGDREVMRGLGTDHQFPMAVEDQAPAGWNRIPVARQGFRLVRPFGLQQLQAHQPKDEGPDEEDHEEDDRSESGVHQPLVFRPGGTTNRWSRRQQQVVQMALVRAGIRAPSIR